MAFAQDRQFEPQPETCRPRPQAVEHREGDAGLDPLQNAGGGGSCSASGRPGTLRPQGAAQTAKAGLTKSRIRALHGVSARRTRYEALENFSKNGLSCLDIEGPRPIAKGLAKAGPNVADIARQNKAVVYDPLFRAASETTMTIAADPRRLGARIGLTAVLHTWGSAMMHHPHVRMIVRAAASRSTDGGGYRRVRPSSCRFGSWARSAAACF